MLTLPNGDLIAGGQFLAAGVAGNIGRWDGTSWSAIGDVIGANSNAGVRALELLRDGTLQVGGDFAIAGGQPSAFLAQWRSTCPASSVVIPTVCTGTTGAVSLTAATHPWVGATFASDATGFAPNALAASFLGFTSPNMPLSVFAPFAGPGCLCLASSEAVALAIPQGGRANYSLPIPNVGAYAGLELFHQFLQLEVGGSAQATLLSSSNGLHLIVGVF
jgi:hypothetical protein